MVQGSLGSPREAERLVAGCDTIIHCAIGTTWGERRKIFSVNVGGTRNLAAAALAQGVRRFVHLSTIALHGPEVVGTMDETTPIRPPKGDDYSESKAEAEQVLLEMVRKGLPAVILRPACVYGPFSNIFITRPVAAMMEGRLRWTRSADAPSNTVYVDNLVEAICRCLEVSEEKVRGEVFTIGDGDAVTWREFFGYFASRLGGQLPEDLKEYPGQPRRSVPGASLLRWLGSWYTGTKAILTCAEFRALGKKAMQVHPLGQLPRWVLERFPALEQRVRRWVDADGLPLYRRPAPPSGEVVHMGSSHFLVSIDKARRVLGYTPVVARERAMELTYEWVKYAHVC
jgi:nucleoside-diphosphate-sugar epimerase